MKFFVKFYTQMGVEIGHSEWKNLGSKWPPRYIQPRPRTWRAFVRLECTLSPDSLIADSGSHFIVWSGIKACKKHLSQLSFSFSLSLSRYFFKIITTLFCLRPPEEGMEWEEGPPHGMMGLRHEAVQLEDVVVNLENQAGVLERGPKINISAIILSCVQTALSMVKDRETDVSRTTKRVAVVLELLQRHTEQGMMFYIRSTSVL